MNAITDVPGILVGQAWRVGEGWLTGVTVVVAPQDGAVGGVDVRGGGPGTRETDLLDPRNSVERVHAVVLTGGSAPGLASADGVVQRLLAEQRGYAIDEDPAHVVPIVPGAVIFDLGRGGEWSNHPDAALGAAAYDAASTTMVEGTVGAGTGAKAGGLKGGVGTAATTLPDGTTLGALVVVNAAGSTVDPATGELWGARHCLPDDLPPMRRPDPAELAAATERAPFPGQLATTLVVIATDVTLTKAQCQKVSGIGHDGMARAIDPVHTMFDGDTVFTLATGEGAAPDRFVFHALLAAAGTTVTRAIVRAIVGAESAGGMRSYREAFPSAFV